MILGFFFVGSDPFSFTSLNGSFSPTSSSSSSSNALLLGFARFRGDLELREEVDEEAKREAGTLNAELEAEDFAVLEVVDFRTVSTEAAGADADAAPPPLPPFPRFTSFRGTVSSSSSSESSST